MRAPRNCDSAQVIAMAVAHIIFEMAEPLQNLNGFHEIYIYSRRNICIFPPARPFNHPPVRSNLHFVGPGPQTIICPKDHEISYRISNIFQTVWSPTRPKRLYAFASTPQSPLRSLLAALLWLRPCRLALGCVLAFPGRIDSSMLEDSRDTRS